jgi:hypothetical protein
MTWKPSQAMTSSQICQKKFKTRSKRKKTASEGLRSPRKPTPHLFCGIGNCIHNLSIHLLLIATGIIHLIQAMLGERFIHGIRLLHDFGQGFSFSSFASRSRIKLIHRAVKEFSCFCANRLLPRILTAPTIRNRFLKSLVNRCPINTLMLRKLRRLLEQGELGVRLWLVVLPPI